MNTRPHASSAPVHPLAWWAWALTLAAAVSLTTNPLLLVLMIAALSATVVVRRTDAPWARSLRAYYLMALVIIGVRLVFQVLFGAPIGSTVLLDLPQLQLPAWAQGIRVGGAVTAEALAWTLYDALRLATILLCLGAANALANPRQVLRSVPAALYEASVAVVIALSVAPQLIESAQRISRARRLRGSSARGVRALPALLVPVMADAVDRSIDLAAAMEARGFGATRRPTHRRRVLALTLIGAMVLIFGAFRFLSGSMIDGVAEVAVGVSAVLIGLRATGRNLGVTRYLPQPWTILDSSLAGCGVLSLALVGVLTTLDRSLLVPPVDPLGWPVLHPLMVAAAVAAAAPIALTRPVTVAPQQGGHASAAAERLRPRVATVGR